MNIEHLFEPAILFIIVQAIAVGFLVSFDVTAYTALTIRRVKLKETVCSWSRLHASYHTAFLCIGIGIFQAFVYAIATAFSKIVPDISALLYKIAAWFGKFTNWLAQKLQAVIEYLAVRVDQLPEILASLFALGLCWWLYSTKLSVAAGKRNEGDIGFANSFRRFGERHFGAAAVAMDMWYLTPTLRGVIDPLPAVQVAAFIVVLFLAVFLFVYTATSSLISFIKTNQHLGDVAVVCISVILLLLEPLGVFYFALYASGIATGIISEHHAGLVILAATIVFLMVRGRFGDIVSHQCAEVADASRSSQDLKDTSDSTHPSLTMPTLDTPEGKL